MKKEVWFLLFLVGLILVGACNEEDSGVIATEKETDDIVQEEDTVILLNHFVSGEFYGDYNGNGTNFISMILSDGIDWNREQEGFTKGGRYISLELNSKINADYMPEAGTYKVCPVVGSPLGTFNPGEIICTEGPCYATSTYLSDVDSTGHEIFTALTSGSIVVSKKENGIYSIEINMKDEDDNPVNAVYEGPLQLVFIGYKYEPFQPADKTFELKQMLRSEYWGDFFRNGTSNMLLDFATEDGNYGVGLELYCPANDRTSITPGTYTISTEDKEMTAKPGYYNGSGVLYPSYAYKLGNIEYEILWWLTSGEVRIDKSADDTYQIEVDAYSYFGSHINAVYNGKLPILDATQSQTMAKPVFNRMKKNINVNK